jgi:hypothetical protein
MKKVREATISPGRHAAECKICAHTQRDEIERDFINWRSPASITKQYKLANRASVYRHAHALGLFPKRQRNVRAALEKIIERAGEVEVNAAAVVSAVTAYARLNSRGELIERSETVNLNSLFERMSTEELDKYARDGALPDWFERVVATGAHGQGVSSENSMQCKTKRLASELTN